MDYRLLIQLLVERSFGVAFANRDQIGLNMHWDINKKLLGAEARFSHALTSIYIQEILLT